MKKRIRQLIINITDICNMECDFCLRGDGMGRKMDLFLIPKIFEGIESVDCITITGGDPSCYVEAVIAIVDYLVEHKDDIDVWGLYIITNGKEYKQELVDAVKTMLLLSLEKDYADRVPTIQGHSDGQRYGEYEAEERSYSFGVAVSLDKFHEPIDIMNYFKYYWSGVYSSTKETDFDERSVIMRGRATNFPDGIERRYYEFNVDLDDDAIDAEEVYITIDGKVFADCDMSYDMEEEYEPAGNLYEETLADVMQRYADKLLSDDSNGSYYYAGLRNSHEEIVK